MRHVAREAKRWDLGVLGSEKVISTRSELVFNNLDKSPVNYDQDSNKTHDTSIDQANTSSPKSNTVRYDTPASRCKIRMIAAAGLTQPTNHPNPNKPIKLNKGKQNTPMT